MEQQVISLAIIILISSLLTIWANRIKVTYPVVLVIAGLIISFLPFLPNIEINHEIIFYIFLPPLIYSSAMALQLKETWSWKRVVLSFAFLVVFLTAAGVGVLAAWMVPGMTLATSLVLGGLLASTDAVSATSIMQQVKVPSRVSNILESESLLNDASSLITFSFALVAVQTGTFVVEEAALSFVWMVVGGCLVGCAIAYFFIFLHKILPDKDSNVTIVFTLIAPYLMYIMAEAAGASGVLGVVSGAFYMNLHMDVVDGKSRLLGKNVWSNLIFVLNGLAFMIIGLKLPEIVDGLKTDGISVTMATIFGLCVTAIIIIIRMVFAFLAIPISRFRRKAEHIGNKRLIVDKPTAVIMGWCGMRGVLSLAAALSIPTLLPNGEAFPYRSLILYCSFVVIFATLVLQGLTLPLFLKHTKFPDYHDHLSEAESNNRIRRALAECGLQYLKEHPVQNPNDQRVFDYLKGVWEKRLEIVDEAPIVLSAAKIYKEVLQQQREYLYELDKKDSTIKGEVIDKFIESIDLEEETIKKI